MGRFDLYQHTIDATPLEIYTLYFMLYALYVVRYTFYHRSDAARDASEGNGQRMESVDEDKKHKGSLHEAAHVLHKPVLDAISCD